MTVEREISFEQNTLSFIGVETLIISTRTHRRQTCSCEDGTEKQDILKQETHSTRTQNVF